MPGRTRALPANPAVDHPDAKVRDAFRALFNAQTGPRLFEDRFRLYPFTDGSGNRLLLFQARDSSRRWVTRMALTQDGALHLAASSVTTSADFTALGWNPGGE